MDGRLLLDKNHQLRPTDKETVQDMSDAGPYSAPTGAKDTITEADEHLSMPSKRYWIVVAILFVFCAGPLAALKVYIVVTGEYDARWLVIYFAFPLAFAGIGFVVTFLLGIVRAARVSFTRR